MRIDIKPFKCVLTFRPEKVYMVLEHQFENVVFADLVIFSIRFVYCVAQKRKASKWEVILKCFKEI